MACTIPTSRYVNKWPAIGGSAEYFDYAADGFLAGIGRTNAIPTTVKFMSADVVVSSQSAGLTLSARS
jgi:hypothetical protein